MKCQTFTAINVSCSSQSPLVHYITMILSYSYFHFHLHLLSAVPDTSRTSIWKQLKREMMKTSTQRIIFSYCWQHMTIGMTARHRAVNIYKPIFYHYFYYYFILRKFFYTYVLKCFAVAVAAFLFLVPLGDYVEFEKVAGDKS